MNPTCAACTKAVYPVEKLSCLDQIWHKACFKCQVCKMVLNMKNYKGFEKKPYCVAHYPKLTATAIADTPEMNRLRENTKLQSQIQYHAEYEKTKDQFTAIADTPEMNRLKESSALASNIGYDQRDHNAPADAGGYNPPPSFTAAPPVQAQVQPPRAAAAPPPAAAAPKKAEDRFKAMFSYDATDEDEITFSEGDIILNGKIVAEGWMQGTLEKTGQTGLLPSNYVEPA